VVAAVVLAAVVLPVLELAATAPVGALEELELALLCCWTALTSACSKAEKRETPLLGWSPGSALSSRSRTRSRRGALNEIADWENRAETGELDISKLLSVQNK
jgi:hypothetical protein